MRDTIASGIGSLLAVIASHVRRPTTSRTDAPHHFGTRVWTGAVTDSGEDPFFVASALLAATIFCVSEAVRAGLLRMAPPFCLVAGSVQKSVTSMAWPRAALRATASVN